MIAVNIHALTDLSLRFSDQLIRNRGGLLNVGSIAGFLPGREWRFITPPRPMCCRSRRRCGELAPHGVRVTVLCPGPVPSEFQARAGFRPGFIRSFLTFCRPPSRQAYRGLMANKRAVMPGIGTKTVPFLLRFFPRSFILGSVAPSAPSALRKPRVFAGESARSGNACVDPSGPRFAYLLSVRELTRN
jgi:short-subunit dehydrogenase